MSIGQTNNYVLINKINVKEINVEIDVLKIIVLRYFFSEFVAMEMLFLNVSF